jgi:uncharacterized membrane protein YfcA
MLQSLLPLLIIFFAVFTQSLAGFGSGLVSMAFLPTVLGVRTAVPLVSMVTGSLEFFLLIRYRTAFNLRAIWRLVLTSIFAIPLGVWALRQVSEQLLLIVLGLVMSGYALYALLNFRLPRLEHPAWAYLAGFLSGLLSGAYSVGGPPAIIYGACRGWKPEEFKSNLQGLFLINDILAIISQAVAGNLTPRVLTGYLAALPVLALGILAGTSLDRRLNPLQFRKIVLLLLVVMGVRLVLQSIL